MYSKCVSNNYNNTQQSHVLTVSSRAPHKNIPLENIYLKNNTTNTSNNQNKKIQMKQLNYLNKIFFLIIKLNTHLLIDSKAISSGIPNSTRDVPFYQYNFVLNGSNWNSCQV